MEPVAELFAEAAYIGKRAGFDIINVHAAGLQQLLGKVDEKERAQMPDQNSGRH